MRRVSGALRDTIRAGEPIRLNRNENAYGPSADVMAAIRDTASTAASRYPDVEAEALRRKIAGCSSSRPRAGGARLRLQRNPAHGDRRVRGRAEEARRRRCRRSSRLADGHERAGATVVGVPVKRDYTHDLNGMLARIDAETRLVYICNPHNPTGRVTRRQDLEAFLRQLPATIVVLMDEAYHHYVGESPDYASFIDRPFDSTVDARDRHAQLFQDPWTGGIARRLCRCRGATRRASWLPTCCPMV